MKKPTFFILILVIGTWCLAPVSFAKPERMGLESQSRKAKKAQAKAMAKSVDLSKISDPETRNALQVIFDSLELKDKKQAIGG